MNKPYFCRNSFLKNTIDVLLFYGEHFYGFSESDYEFSESEKPFFTEKGSQHNQNITLIEKNAQYRKNAKLQIFSANVLLISQRHWTYQNGNHKKNLPSKI